MKERANSPTRIIDAHMHFSNIAAFHRAAKEDGVDYSLNGFFNEYAQNGISAAICMGLGETANGRFPDARMKTPMLADLEDELPSNLYLCPGVNPHHLTPADMERLDDALTNGVGGARAVGIKLYAGYYDIDLNDRAFDPVYELALRHDVPVVIHAGDTFSPDGILMRSHPLNMDRLAVARRNLRIVICHLAYPWMIDACEIAYKNPNVWLDVSGLIVGGRDAFEYITGNPRYMDFHRLGFDVLGNYKKVLFGTDWPLTPIDQYIEFIKLLIPPFAWEDVFWHNAKDLFRLPV